MAHQFNILILLVGVVQGSLLSIMLLRKKAFREVYAFLAVYIFALIVQLVVKVINKTWMIDHSEPLYSLSYHLPLVYGPLVYLLSKKIVRPDFKLFPFAALHFVPFAVSLSTEELGIYSSSRIYGFFVLQSISVNVYHLLAYKLWIKPWTNRNSCYSPAFLGQLQWLRRFLTVSWVVIFLIVLANFLLYKISPAWSAVRWSFLLLTIFIYWISATALETREIFSVIKGEGKDAGRERSSLHLNKHVKYRGSGLSAEEATHIGQALKIVMAEKKPFLDPSLNLSTLANLIPCPRHYLSQVLNDSLGKNFNDFVNQYRIEEAKARLSDPKRNHVKMIVVAEESGFKSISSFNDVFKKHTLVTPSQFRSGVQSESQSHSA